MTEKELTLFRSTLTNTKYLLEFGSGGSTYYAIKNGITVFSIESSLSFIKIMEKSSLIKRAIKNNKLLYYHANIGLTGEWSIPINTNVDGYKYWGIPLKQISQMNKPICSHWENIDTVFIDGRYRVACALNLLFHFPKLDKIIFHDYLNNPQYKIIENFYSCVDHSDTLAIFKPQKDINLCTVENTLNIYRNIYE